MATPRTKAINTLLAHSQAPTLDRAAAEWRLTHAYQGAGDGAARCDLCDHAGLRHQFEIENTTTHERLWVGAECIISYIPITTRGATITDPEEKAAYVHRLVANIKKGARLQRAYALLDALRARDDRFRGAHWKGSWRAGYTVKQLQLVAVVARTHELPFNAADFRINTRRDGVPDDLGALEWWQYRQLRGALTPERRHQLDAYFRAHFAHRAALILGARSEVPVRAD